MRTLSPGGKFRNEDSGRNRDVENSRSSSQEFQKVSKKSSSYDDNEVRSGRTIRDSMAQTATRLAAAAEAAAIAATRVSYIICLMTIITRLLLYIS